MSKRKVSFSLSGGESSRKSSEKKHKKGEEEISSKMKQPPRASSKIQNLLSGTKAVERYIADFARRDIELGRVVEFDWLEKESALEIDVWLNVVGWKNFVSINEPVYPRLLRVLYANLNPLSMVSCIGSTEVRLGVDAWCDTFGIPNLDGKEESFVRNKSKEEIFQDLFGKEGLGVRNWVNVNELPPDPTTRLAANILMNVLIPKKGSKEQVKEEEGRILYSLKHGTNLNLAREIVERMRQCTMRKSTPLCYAMHLMVLLKKAGVNLKCAGDKAPLLLKTSSHINAVTLGRLGFKKDFNNWILVGRGRVKGKFSGESSPSTSKRTAEESQRGTEEEMEEGGAAAESSAPEHPQPSSSTHFTSSPHLNRQLINLQTTLTNHIAHLSSSLSEKLDFFTATVNSRLENMDLKLDDLSLRVRRCETLLQPPAAQPSPPHTTPQPPPPTHVPSPPQPAQASTSSTPTQPLPIPIPSSSPPTSPPKEPESSPLFSMDELLQSAPILQPDLPTPTPPTQTQSSQPAPSHSASNQALQVVCSTLQIDKPKRYKMTATKHASKPSKHHSKEPPK